jgi:uncharacterized protein YkwD
VRRGFLLIAAIAGLATGCASTGSAPTRSAKTSPCGEVGAPAETLGVQRTRDLTFCLLNEERAREGVAALRYDARLEAASQGHSEDMVGRRYFEHDSPEGVEAYRRMLAAGYPATNAFTGENIAWGEGPESSPAEIVDSWMQSPPHREALLHPQYSEVGVGVAFGAPEPDPGATPAATYTTDFGGPPIR